MSKFTLRNDLPNPRGDGNLSSPASGWEGVANANLGTVELEQVTDDDFGDCVEVTLTPSAMTSALVVLANQAPIGMQYQDLIYLRVLAKQMSGEPNQILTASLNFYTGGPFLISTSQPIFLGPIDHPAEGFHTQSSALVGFVGATIGLGLTDEPAVFRMLPQLVVKPWGDQPRFTDQEEEIVSVSVPAFGLNDYQLQEEEMPVAIEDDVRLHRQVGSSIVRFPFTYSSKGHIPQTEAGGEIDWGPFGEIMDAYRDAGLRVMPLIWQAPPWMNNSATDYSFGSLPQASYDDFAALHADLLEQWGDIIVAVEFANEPNLGEFWGATAPAGSNTPIDPAKFAAVLGVLYPTLKAVAPDIPVVAGGLSHCQTNSAANPRRMSVSTFMDGMLDAGAGDFCDAISCHPYPAGNTTAPLAAPGTFGGGMWTVLEQIRAQLISHSLEKPIWVTEVGYPVVGGGGGLKEEHDQARAVALIRGMLSRTPDVDGVIIHTGWGDPDDALNAAPWQLVRTPNLTFRPAAGLLV